MIIVIDGPAGSGKSSSAKEIASLLDIKFLDSGALYRALTFVWLELGQPAQSEFFHFLEHVQMQAEYVNDQFVITYNNKDITNEIRKNNVADNVSNIASLPPVRNLVNNLMRNMVKKDLFIADGRDLGTAVFPNAEVKFFMQASLEARANRRYSEVKESQPDVTLEMIKENLKKRDHLDSTREMAPLKKADDAVVIDTTKKTFEEQIQEMIHIIETKIKLKQ